MGEMVRVEMAIALTTAVALSTACRHGAVESTAPAEDSAAKAVMQGIWVDDDTRQVFFRADGDTVYYPDAAALPAYFRIVADTLWLGPSSAGYAIERLTPEELWFAIGNGDVIHLSRSDEDDDTLAFAFRQPTTLTVSHYEKRDTVVYYLGERYHCYVTVNPTKYKVTLSSYNDDGVEVEHVYYDNIIHISVYQGSRRLFGTDLRKDTYHDIVPEQFLAQSVLGNVDFGSVDARGFHFVTTICIPDGASCYMLDTRVTHEGSMEIELIEY